jgi:subtilisin family serine protease
VDSGNSRGPYANFGPCVDVFAPGVLILSAIPGEGKILMTGTSTASAHVAGIIATFASLWPKTFKSVPNGLARFYSMMSKNRVLNAKRARNLMAYISWNTSRELSYPPAPATEVDPVENSANLEAIIPTENNDTTRGGLLVTVIALICVAAVVFAGAVFYKKKAKNRANKKELASQRTSLIA